MSSASIPEKARRIIPTLGSPVDGEALGAARAIGRVLSGAGLSYHDLAAAIPVAAEARRPVPPGARSYPIHPDPPGQKFGNFADWRRAWGASGRPHFTPRQERAQREQAAYCRMHDRGRLSPRERAFIRDIDGQRHGLTVRQSDWLAVICDRLEQEDRRQWQ